MIPNPTTLLLLALATALLFYLALTAHAIEGQLDYLLQITSEARDASSCVAWPDDCRE